ELVEALQLAAQHVVEDEHVIVAGTLGRLRVVADHHGVRADLRLGKHHAESHVLFFLCRRFASCRAGCWSQRSRGPGSIFRKTRPPIGYHSGISVTAWPTTWRSRQ